LTPVNAARAVRFQPVIMRITGEAMGENARGRGKGRPSWPGRIIGCLLVIALSGLPALADSPWTGPYMVLGLGLNSHRPALDRLEGAVDGRPVQLGQWGSDAGFVALGHGMGRGRGYLGVEIEAEPGARPIASGAECRLGRACARAGLIGTMGPVYRLRALAGHEIAPGVMAMIGIGPSLARVQSSRVFVQSASAASGAAALTRASSPFDVDDLARGIHASIGIVHAGAGRAQLGLSVMVERLHVSTQSRVSLATMTLSGPSHAFAALTQRGGFDITTRAIRLSLVWRF
jgi:hypothetical protein